MSSNLNDSPPHFIVLNAISKNFNTTDKIVRYKVTKPEVEKILKELEDQKLISGFDKKSFFFGKKRQYGLNEIGVKVLGDKNQRIGRQNETGSAMVFTRRQATSSIIYGR